MSSRTTITSIDGAGVEGREALRRTHGVRLVEPAEEGASIQALPNGVYGFTYSPAIAAPVFRTFRYRSYEMHRVGGDVFIIGFVTSAEAAGLAGGATATIRLHHDREGAAHTLAVVPYMRIMKHKQFSVRDTASLELTLRLT